MSETIVLRAGGKVFSRWTSISVQRSFRGLCGTFEFVASGGRAESSAALRAQQSCTVEVAGKRIMTGWVEKTTRVGDSDVKNVKVEGRDITCDLVDCSVLWPPPVFDGQTLGTIAKGICQPFGIVVQDLSNSLDVYQNYRINKGEKIFECLSRASALKNLWCITNENGNLIITKGGAEYAEDALVAGQNILSYQVEEDFSGRFSEIQVHPSADPIVAEMLTEAQIDSISIKDTEVKRFRPLLTIGEETTAGLDFLKQRADFEQRLRKGQSQTVTVTVKGFLQRRSGKIWKPDLQVSVDIPEAKISGKLVIADVRWDYSDAEGDKGGPRTTMQLVRPEALSVAAPAVKNPFLEVIPDTAGGAGGGVFVRVPEVL